MENSIKVIKSQNLSQPFEPRYIVINMETGEILDDAQGYGFKTIKGAYSAYAYTHRDKSKDKEKQKERRKIAKWLRDHLQFNECLTTKLFYAMKYGEDLKINTELVRSILKELNLEVDFHPTTLISVWKNDKWYREEKGEK